MYYYLVKVNMEAASTFLFSTRDFNDIPDELKKLHPKGVLKVIGKKNHSIALSMDDALYGIFVDGGDWVDIPVSNIMYEALYPALNAQGFTGNIKEQPGPWLLRIHMSGLLEQRSLKEAVNETIRGYSISDDDYPTQGD